MAKYLIEINGERQVVRATQPILGNVICEVPDSIDPGDYDYLVVTETTSEMGLPIKEVSVDVEARDADPDYEEKRSRRVL